MYQTQGIRVLKYIVQCTQLFRLSKTSSRSCATLGIFLVLKPKACQMMAECSIEQAHNMSELFRV